MFERSALVWSVFFGACIGAACACGVDPEAETTEGTSAPSTVPAPSATITEPGSSTSSSGSSSSSTSSGGTSTSSSSGGNACGVDLEQAAKLAALGGLERDGGAADGGTSAVKDCLACAITKCKPEMGACRTDCPCATALVSCAKSGKTKCAALDGTTAGPALKRCTTTKCAAACGG